MLLLLGEECEDLLHLGLLVLFAELELRATGAILLFAPRAPLLVVRRAAVPFHQQWHEFLADFPDSSALFRGQLQAIDADQIMEDARAAHLQLDLLQPALLGVVEDVREGRLLGLEDLVGLLPAFLTLTALAWQAHELLGRPVHERLETVTL